MYVCTYAKTYLIWTDRKYCIQYKICIELHMPKMEHAVCNDNNFLGLLFRNFENKGKHFYHLQTTFQDDQNI